MCRSQRPHIANLRAVVCVGRLPDPITGFAGPALPTTVRDQSEDEPLAPAATPDPRRAAEQFVHGTDDGGEGKRHDRSHVEAEGCGSHCCSPAQVGSVERRIVRGSRELVDQNRLRSAVTKYTLGTAGGSAMAAVKS